MKTADLGYTTNYVNKLDDLFVAYFGGGCNGYLIYSHKILLAFFGRGAVILSSGGVSWHELILTIRYTVILDLYGL